MTFSMRETLSEEIRKSVCPGCRSVYATALAPAQQFCCSACRAVVTVLAGDPLCPEGTEFGSGAEIRLLPPISRIRYERFLNAGAMGEIYRACHLALGIPLVVKLLKKDGSIHPAAIDQFLREAQLAARIRHPNVVRVLDCGESWGIHFIVMEYLPGESIGSLLARKGRLPWPEALRLIASAARGLQALDEAGIIHRDIKPENILLAADGAVVLVDFGLAMQILPGQAAGSPRSMAGTPQYMSPEHFQTSREIDIRADIYSLGASLYHMLTGAPPVEGQSLGEIIHRLLYSVPLPLSRRVPDIPEPVSALVEKMQQKSREKRFRNPAELLAALEAISPEPPPAADTAESAQGKAGPAPILFRFVGYGTLAPPAEQNRGNLFLDVGNLLCPGVIDHHHLSSYAGSTARLILTHPDFVRQVRSGASAGETPITLTLHHEPDLDCVASAYLAMRLLRCGELPEGSESLAYYLDRVDGGYLGLTPENPFSLYTAYLAIVHRHALRSWRRPEDRWRKCVEEGLEVVAYALEESVRKGIPLIAVDAFSCPEVLGEIDRREIRMDMQRYRAKMENPECHARAVSLRLPSLFGGAMEVDGLLIRHVQSPGDPDRCLFFKDWARTDAQRSAGGAGFTALCIFEEAGPSRGRCILSVKPESGVSLRGMGGWLDREESLARIRMLGRDDRLDSPARPGYDNSDPWYDGRSHSFTIVDSPRSGTVLAPDGIEELFLQYATQAEPSTLHTRQDLPSLSVEDDLHRLSCLAAAWERQVGADPPPLPVDVYLSCPSETRDWAQVRLLEPLQACRPGIRVFHAGALSEEDPGRLAEAIGRLRTCRMFVAILSPAFLQSIYCRWELQQALIRDPQGRNKIILPVGTEMADGTSLRDLGEIEVFSPEAALARMESSLPPG